jgi:hypothetical protein
MNNSRAEGYQGREADITLLQKDMTKALEERLGPKIDPQAVIQAGKEFTDNVFPPTAASIGNVGQGLSWERAGKIFNGKQVLFNQLAVDDIIQGELGSCYFLAAASALAEVPYRVEKLFLTGDANKAGCYPLQLCLCGAPKKVILDDYVVVNKQKKPAFTGSKAGELWVMLLEKAYAKVHGRFETIEGGDARESLNVLTGAPTELVKHETYAGKLDELWKILSTSDEKNYIMCTGAKNDNNGVLRAHAYTLIGTREENVNGRNVRLVQVRNPWGQGEWQGRWSDKDSVWTAELRTRFHHKNADDGTFFMDFSDFAQVYAHTTICKVNDSYFYSSLEFESEQAVAVFEVTSKFVGYLSATQLTTRLGKTFNAGFRQGQLMVTLYKRENNSSKKLKEAPNDALGAARIEVDLEPGVYILTGTFASPTQGIPPYIAISSYASKAIEMKKLDVKSAADVKPEMVKAALGETAKDGFAGLTAYKPGSGDLTRCAQKHPLLWTKEASAATFKCEACRKASKRADGFWNCAKCKFDVCPKCRAGPKVEVLKPEEGKQEGKQGSKSVFVSPGKVTRKSILNPAGQSVGPLMPKPAGPSPPKPPAPTPSPTKPVVPSPSKPDAPAPPQPAPSPSPTKQAEITEPVTEELEEVQCEEGHKMKFVAETNPKAKYLCNQCSKLFLGRVHRWRCDTCDFDLCRECEEPPSNFVQEGPIPEVTECGKGHPLAYVTDYIESGTYQCDVCKMMSSCGDGRWACATCGQNLCTVCKPNEEGERGDQLPFAETTSCTEGHPLVYSTKPYPENDKFICDKCDKLDNAVEGRWHCKACQYDICSECRDPPEGNQDAVCINGHMLEFSKLGYAGGTLARCDTCDKTFKVTAGRYCCKICRYDLCQECLPNTGAIPTQSVNVQPGSKDRKSANKGKDNTKEAEAGKAKETPMKPRDMGMLSEKQQIRLMGGDVADQINLARQVPGSLIPALQERLKQFDEKFLLIDPPVETYEGPRAVLRDQDHSL